MSGDGKRGLKQSHAQRHILHACTRPWRSTQASRQRQQSFSRGARLILSPAQKKIMQKDAGAGEWRWETWSQTVTCTASRTVVCLRTAVAVDAGLAPEAAIILQRRVIHLESCAEKIMQKDAGAGEWRWETWSQTVTCTAPRTACLRTAVAVDAGLAPEAAIILQRRAIHFESCAEKIMQKDAGAGEWRWKA